MKFHRVKGTLPVGVVSSVATRSAISPTGGFYDRLIEHAFQEIEERTSSNAPLTLTLDVPEAAAAETAKVLRAMAAELEGTRT